MKTGLALLVCGATLAIATAASGQTLSLQDPASRPRVAAIDPATVEGLPSARDYRPPDGIVFEARDFFSENVRLTSQWFHAAGNQGRALPTVIMAPGWGATAANLRDDAVELAHAGYLVMLFDYRGWGDSDGRVLLTRQPSAVIGASPDEVRQLRGYVDPWEQSEDWFNAISYALANPRVDADRVGLRGSDLSGGYVLHAAARDPRVKAVVSQVTWADLRPSKPYQRDPVRAAAEANAAATQIATGQATYPADRARVGGRVGAPVGNKLARWTPIDAAGDVAQPALFVLAEQEELFSNVFNGQMACERVQGPRKMVILPKITHYDIYGLERERAITAAIDWFDNYLKPPGAPTRAPIDRKEAARGPCNPPPLPPADEEPKDGTGQGHKAQNTSSRYN